MKILDEIGIHPNKSELIVFVGAGGKTTGMFTLAKELKALGKKVLVTTTTAIYYPFKNQYDDILISNTYNKKIFSEINASSIFVFGSRINDENKLLGCKKEDIDSIFKENLFDYILVEGDGSKKRPIKAPAGHEPVIPSLSTIVIGVIGMDSLGKPINAENVHRPEILCRITGSNMNDIINDEILSKLVISDQGLFKGTPKQCKRYLMLSKADKSKDRGEIEAIKNKVIQSNTNLEKIFISPRKEVVS